VLHYKSIFTGITSRAAGTGMFCSALSQVNRGFAFARRLVRRRLRSPESPERKVGRPLHRVVGREAMIPVMNVRTGAIAGTISGLKGVHAIAIVPELRCGFITNSGDDTISIVDLKTLQKIGTTKAGKNPDVIAFDAVTKRVFFMNGDSKDATAIDAASGSIAGIVGLGGQPSPPSPMARAASSSTSPAKRRSLKSMRARSPSASLGIGAV
jgi:YVTN family beta-propeller protein